MNLDSQINEVLHLCGVQINEEYEDAMDYADSVEDIPYNEFLDKFSQDDALDNHINRQDFLKQLRKLLLSLNPREEYTIRRYFGIDCEPKSALAISKELGMNKNWVHDNINRIINKLKHPSRQRYVRQYHN